MFFLFFLLATMSLTGQENTKLPLAIKFAEESAEKWGLSSSDLDNLMLSSEMYSQKSGIQYVYLQQTYEGIPIQNAMVTISINKNNQLIHAAPSLIANVKDKVNAKTPGITMEQAIVSGAEHLDISFASKPTQSARNEKGQPVFTWKEVSDTEIEPKLMYVSVNKKLVLVWNFHVDMIKNSDYWSMNIDAQTGEFVKKDNLTVYCTHHKNGYAHAHNCSIKTFRKIEREQVPVSEAMTSAGTAKYNVYALPAESPNHGPRAIVSDDQFPEASPFGWHDADGVAGPEFTTTRGNNVYAFQDRDNDDQSDGNDPIGGDSLVFDFLVDQNQEYEQNEDAAVTNLFYMVNMLHDLTHHLGFDEAAGNFQAKNYQGLPGEDDYVLAQAFDGIDLGTPTLNNANFSTPGDGGNGRMQMYLWENPGGAVSIDSPDAIKGFIKEYGQAQFGRTIPTGTEPPITAQVVIGKDNTSTPTTCCNNLTNSAEANGKIVLVDRGICNFSRKVYRAQTAGAVAVIICNVAGISGGNGEELINMASGDFGDQVTIPSIFMKKSDCDRIRVSLGEGNAVTMTLQNRERTGPEYLDGAFDNGIIAHEFGHGISNRLTGGRLNSGCLGNDEQMGEGWSDFFALIFTTEPGDNGADIRGIGTFAQNQPVEGSGIRRYPYSTSMEVNPQTYDNIKGTTAPHPLGEVWTDMLWDMYWKFIDLYGFDPDWTNVNSGNHRAAFLVMEGMKMQPCNPGFIAGRDAILMADRAIYNGDHQCLIWDVFARRGLGYLAEGGDADDRNDGTQNFESLPTCIATLKISKKLSKKLIQPGDEVTVELTANNHFSVKESDVVITDELEDGLTYVDGSSPVTPQINGNVLSFAIGDLNYDTEYKLTYKVRANTINKSTTLFLDDFENDINWDLVTDNGAETWLPDYENYHSFETAMYVPNFEQELDASIITFYDVPVNGENPALRFWHQYNTELTNDGGILELSVDGGEFFQVKKDKFIANGYDSEINYSTLAIPALYGFTGSTQGQWKDSYVDLSAYKGSNIKLKFRFGASDGGAPTTGIPGWLVDDIELMELFKYATKTCITSPNNNVCTDIQEVIVDTDGSVSTKDESIEYFKMSILPNPAGDYAVIKTEIPVAQHVEVKIHTADGKVVSSWKKWMPARLNHETLSTAAWGKGIYLVTLTTVNHTTTQKLIVR